MPSFLTQRRESHMNIDSEFMAPGIVILIILIIVLFFRGRHTNNTYNRKKNVAKGQVLALFKKNEALTADQVNSRLDSLPKNFQSLSITGVTQILNSLVAEGKLDRQSESKVTKDLTAINKVTYSLL